MHCYELSHLLMNLYYVISCWRHFQIQVERMIQDNELLAGSSVPKHQNLEPF